MAEIPLTWKLQILGANEVKTKLQELNSQFDRNEISASEYAKGLREVNTNARAFVNIGNTQKNILLATNPVLNTLSRSMSTISSVSRSFLTILNAINLARIAGRGLSSEELELNKQIAEVMRTINRETDPAKLSQLNEELAILKTRLKELSDEKFFETLQNIGGIFFGLGLTLATLKPLFPTILKGFSALRVILGAGSFLEALGIVAASFIGIGAAFAAIGVFSAIVGKFIADFLVSLFGLDEWRENNGRLLVEFFTVMIPQALGFMAETITSVLPLIKEGLVGLANAVILTVNSMGSALVNGLNVIVVAIQSFVNSMIAVYNRIASKLSRLGVSIPRLSPVSLPTMTFTAIPLIKAATGFEGIVNKPLNILAGEDGPEHVSITPLSKGRSSGNTIIIHNHIAGSIITERELFRKVDQAFKESLKRRGFTGV